MTAQQAESPSNYGGADTYLNWLIPRWMSWSSNIKENSELVDGDAQIYR
jgi:hypothetical protein